MLVGDYKATRVGGESGERKQKGRQASETERKGEREGGRRVDFFKGKVSPSESDKRNDVL